MRKLFGKISYRALLSLALAMAALAGLLAPAGAAFVEFDYNKKLEGDELNIVEFYEWHRVSKQSDLPTSTYVTYPVLIMWQYDNVVYYGDGGLDYKADYDGKWDAFKGKAYPMDDPFYPNPFKEKTENCTSFYTLDCLTHFSMRNRGSKDGSNGGAIQVRIFPAEGAVLDGYDDFDWNKGDSTNNDAWTVMTNDISSKKTKYVKGLNNGYVRIYHEVYGEDVGFMWTKDKLFGYEEDTYSYDQFIMYWGEKRTYSAITDNIVVGSGMVMNIDDGVLIMDDVTVIVEPGGVLSVEGQLFNNGVIENHGTVILQKDACISSFIPSADNAGQIICDGSVVDASASAERMWELKKKKKTEVDAQYTTYKNVTIPDLKNKAGECRVQVNTGVTDEAKADYEAYLAEVAQWETDLEKQIKTEYEALAPSYLIPTIKDPVTLEQYREWYYPESTLAREKKKIADKHKSGIKCMELQEALDKAEAALTEAETTMANLDAQSKKLEEEITYWRGIMQKNNTGKQEEGEGNLLILKNARLAFNHKKESRLVIKNGGSCVCNGYIISPSYITLDNSSMIVRPDGAVLLEYVFTSNLGAIRTVQPTGSDTSLTFPGLSERALSSGHSMVCSNDYYLHNEGVINAAHGVVYNADNNEEIEVQNRVVDPVTGDITYYGKDGQKSLEILHDGTRIEYNYMGAALMSTQMTYANGCTLTKDHHGYETFRDAAGNMVYQLELGELIIGSRTLEDGTVESIYDNCLSYDYPEPYVNGLMRVEKYRAGSSKYAPILSEKHYYEDGRTEYYGYGGKFEKTVQPGENEGESIVTYSDRVELQDAYDRAIEIEYTSGIYAGARVSINADAYYDNANFDHIVEGEIVWTLSSVKGPELVCRAVTVVDMMNSYASVEDREAHAQHLSAVMKKKGAYDVYFNMSVDYTAYLLEGELQQSYNNTAASDKIIDLVAVMPEATGTDEKGAPLYYYTDGSTKSSITSQGLANGTLVPWKDVTPSGTAYYDAKGNIIQSDLNRPGRNPGETVIVYPSSREETVNASGQIVHISYLSEALKGVEVTINQKLYYVTPSAKNWTEGEIIWSMTNKNGYTIDCRAANIENYRASGGMSVTNGTDLNGTIMQGCLIVDSDGSKAIFNSRTGFDSYVYLCATEGFDSEAPGMVVRLPDKTDTNFMKETIYFYSDGSKSVATKTILYEYLYKRYVGTRWKYPKYGTAMVYFAKDDVLDDSTLSANQKIWDYTRSDRSTMSCSYLGGGVWERNSSIMGKESVGSVFWPDDFLR